MKKTLRWLSLIVVAALCVVFLAVFFSMLFNKRGDTVYVVAVTGDVQIGTTDDLNRFETAQAGMTLSSGDIVLTGDRSSCVLAYDKNADSKDNFISINSGTQVYVCDKNAQGGYNFLVTDGSVICNMPNADSLETSVSTHVYNLFVSNTIAKVDYNAQDEVGKVFVFDGNPYVQIVQPSGSEGKTEKLLKNSVCAVRSMKDGSVGFGCLNTGFGLNEFSAQDLRTMSGIANVWAERISYSTGEFEQAFQTASDHADYTAATVATVNTSSEPVDVYTEPSDTSVVSTELESVEIFESVETTEVISTFEPDYDGLPVYTEFTRPTLVDLSESEPEETMTASTSRTTASHVVTTSETTVQTTTTPKPVVVTTAVTTIATTTAPVVKVDPDATYTVIFTYNEDGNDYWAIQLVKHGQSAIAPDVLDIEGKYFVKWDTDFSHVTSDMTITGIFAEGKKPVENHIVKFYVDDQLWKTVSVKDGGSVELDDEPESGSRKFVGWSDDIANVTSDMTVFALFSD